MDSSLPTYNKKIIVVLTNVSKILGSRIERPVVESPLLECSDANLTGCDVKAVAYIWELFCRRNSWSIIFASPRGGYVPMDPSSIENSQQDQIVLQFMQAKSSTAMLKNTQSIAELANKISNKKENVEYCAILLLGNHGALVDFPESSAIAKAVAAVYQSGGYVCAIGHGCAGLLKAKVTASAMGLMVGRIFNLFFGKYKHSEYLISGKKLTCPSNEEEEKLKITDRLPFLVQEKFEELRVKPKFREPFVSNVVIDDQIITAQNSESIQEWIDQILQKLACT